MLLFSSLLSSPLILARRLTFVFTSVLLLLGSAVDAGRPPELNWLSMKGKLPAPRYGAAALAYEGRIYLFGGGLSGGDSYQDALVSTPSVDKWSVFCVIPRPRINASVMIVNRRILLMGGQGPNAGIIDQLDLRTMTWTDTGISLPHGDVFARCIEFDGAVFVFYAQEVWRYDWPKGPWKNIRVTQDRRPRDPGALVKDSKRIYLIGGAAARVEDVEVFDPIGGAFDEPVPSMLIPVGHPSAVLLDGYALAIGGEGSGPGNGLEISLPGQAWSLTTKEMKVWRYQASCAVLNHHVYVAGGINQYSVPTDTVEAGSFVGLSEKATPTVAPQVGSTPSVTPTKEPSGPEATEQDRPHVAQKIQTPSPTATIAASPPGKAHRPLSVGENSNNSAGVAASRRPEARRSSAFRRILGGVLGFLRTYSVQFLIATAVPVLWFLISWYSKPRLRLTGRQLNKADGRVSVVVSARMFRNFEGVGMNIVSCWRVSRMRWTRLDDGQVQFPAKLPLSVQLDNYGVYLSRQFAPQPVNNGGAPATYDIARWRGSVAEVPVSSGPVTKCISLNLSNGPGLLDLTVTTKICGPRRLLVKVWLSKGIVRWSEQRRLSHPFVWYLVARHRRRMS